MKRLVGPTLIVLCLAGVAPAQQIGNRTQLNNLLSNGYEYMDAFEAYNIGQGGSTWMNSATLNNTSIINGQGPGLVDPGAQYTSVGANGNLQWDGANYFGSKTKEILSGTTELAVDYTLPVNAMGIDLRDFAGLSDAFSVDVWNGSTLVGTYNGTFNNSGNSQFFGWYNASGITAVDFFSGANWWSPIIDNHAYGYAPVPEPASMAVLALGAFALRRRRR